MIKNTNATADNTNAGRKTPEEFAEYQARKNAEEKEAKLHCGCLDLYFRGQIGFSRPNFEPDYDFKNGLSNLNIHLQKKACLNIHLPNGRTLEVDYLDDADRGEITLRAFDGFLEETIEAEVRIIDNQGVKSPHFEVFSSGDTSLFKKMD